MIILAIECARLTTQSPSVNLLLHVGADTSSVNLPIMICIPIFPRRGLLGGYLQRIWTELVASFSEQHARDLFECKDVPTVRGAVTALVVVSIQHVPFGPLAILDWEERFFWEYYNRTVMVSMKVEHVCELTGLACNIRGARVNSGNQPFFWKLHPDSVGELCRHARVQAFLAEHGLDARQATDTLVHAVAVWPPVGYLVAKQKWSFVAMGGFQKRVPKYVLHPFKRAWKAARELYAVQPINRRAQDADLHNPLSLRELADNVRAWAAVMIQNQAFDHEDQKFKLEATVQLFESKADSLEELRRQSWMESFGRHGFQRRFKMLQLLRLVILVKDVRTATRTEQVLVSSLRSLFPLHC